MWLECIWHLKMQYLHKNVQQVQPLTRTDVESSVSVTFYSVFDTDQTFDIRTTLPLILLLVCYILLFLSNVDPQYHFSLKIIFVSVMPVVQTMSC